MNDEQRNILRIVARDIDAILVPAINSDSAKFVAGTMKTLLDRLVATADAPAVEPSRNADWTGLIAQAEDADRRALAGEQTSRESAWQQSGSGARSERKAASGRVQRIEPDHLLDYLKNRQNFSWAEHCSVTQAAGGFSKDTFLVTLVGANREMRLVLRRDQSFRPLLTSVTEEHDVLCKLSAAGFPVPRPVWIESDPTWFGAAVLATAWLNGSADSTRWSSDPAVAKIVLTDAAQLLGRLHAFPLDTVSSQGSGVPGSRGDTPQAQAKDLQTFWEMIRVATNPLMERVLQWLIDNAPATFARKSIVHADFGFHNLMVDGAAITGLLDWEFWHIGDAREDLAYTRSFVEGVMPWDEFRRVYEAAGGCESDAAADRFYSVLGGTRVALGCYALQSALHRQPDQIDSKMTYVGQSFARSFLIEAAKIATKT